MSQTTPITDSGSPFPQCGPWLVPSNLPEIYEDEGQEEMGDAAAHTDAINILLYGIRAHLARQSQYQVFSNLNVYYHPKNEKAYVSPDVMVVIPRIPLESPSSYRIDADGPAPILVVEVLSPRTGQQGDLKVKPPIYAGRGVAEYMLLDPQGLFLERTITLWTLQPNKEWRETNDVDGGVTSALGFRVTIDEDGILHVSNAATGRHYIRPDEAEEAKREEELARIRAEQEKQIAEDERRREELARIRAEQEKQIAEDERRTEELARIRAEQEKRTEELARIRAEDERRTEELARIRAEEDKRIAVEKMQIAEDARRNVEKENELAQSRLRELEAEVARLKAQSQPENPK